MKTFRILAFDGGGVKGALSVKILSKLCEKFPNLLDSIDLFAGTSTGSIIAGLLATNVDPVDIDNLYNIRMGKKIFSKPSYNFFRPKFKNKNLKKILYDNFDADLKIKDLKRNIFIPTFNINGITKNSWEPYFFNNLTDNSSLNYKLIDAILASSSAPIYFPSHNGFIDGGIIANSPTTSSVIFSASALGNSCKLKQIKLLSIGTSNCPRKITGKTHKWGILQWSFNLFGDIRFPILSLLMDGMTDLEDMYCKQMLNSNYFRINPMLPDIFELDSYKYIPDLKLMGEKYDLTSAYNYIENIFLK